MSGVHLLPFGVMHLLCPTAFIPKTMYDETDDLNIVSSETHVMPKFDKQYACTDFY